MTYRKQSHRTGTCERQDKVAYGSEEEARDALRVLRVLNRAKNVRVYKCPGGEPHWHLGRGPSRKRYS